MKLYSLRLRPGQDLRDALLTYAKQNNIRAGSIVTCVGELKSFTLRMAGATPDQEEIRAFNDPHEIVSLVGTLTGGDCHLHIALSSKTGNVIGGHLKQNSFVGVTAEIVIAEHEGVAYDREFDATTGYSELVIRQ